MTSLLQSSAPAQEAWAALGGRSADLERVQVTGDPAGLLPSRLKVQELMTAAVGSALLAVAALDAARNEAPLASVSLSAEHVAVAARSERYARRTGSDAGAQMAPLSRFWKAADGWVRLHANYPWHLRRALDVLGCEDHPGQVGQAIAARTTADLEDSFAAAGGLAFAVRSLGEWTGHPQGRAVAAQPLVRTETGPGRGRRLSAGRALHGIKVLDLTRVIAGPVATRTLAAWGADVLRVDSPHLPEIPAQTTDTLHGKRSALLDLASPPRPGTAGRTARRSGPAGPGLPARCPPPVRPGHRGSRRTLPPSQRGHAVGLGTGRPVVTPPRVRLARPVPHRYRRHRRQPRSARSDARPGPRPRHRLPRCRSRRHGARRQPTPTAAPATSSCH